MSMSVQMCSWVILVTEHEQEPTPTSAEAGCAHYGERAKLLLLGTCAAVTLVWLLCHESYGA